MNPKRFWGRDMGEALRAVRSTLGPDALIMDTSTGTSEGNFGIEITAFAAGQTPDDSKVSEVDSAVKKTPDPFDEVRQELAALKSMLGWLAPGLSHRDEISRFLVDQGVAPEIIGRMAAASKDFNGLGSRESIYYALSQLIPTGGQIRPGRDCLALVGATGAGKTTALIKLTVFETQRRRRRVGWVNTDQQGLKASDPLAVYAAILGVSYETAVLGEKELKRAMGRLTDCDLILVDTPGVNPRNEEGINGLTRTLHSFPELRAALLLSAATNGRDMADWVRIYSRARLDSLFFTKLDECRHFGPLINTALGSGLQLSYLTLGQNLAGDLEIAKPEVLASLVLTGVHRHD
jgi:flagellar biosynthesis GTPase FlhF